VLESVRRTLAEAYQNQKFPFERLLELLNVEPAGNRSPLFNAVAVMENINNKTNIEHLMNDVTLVFSINGAELIGTVEYNSELFERESIALYAEHYRSILRSMVDKPDTKISDIELLTSNKRQELIRDFNSTASDYPKAQNIVQLFAEKASKTPDKLAVTWKDESLSYGQLESRSNRLAQYLRARGVGRGVNVGIYLEHSLETFVALLGVLKAGGTYVPFEPAHPPSRLVFMLADAEIQLVLTQKALAERISEVETLCLDTDWAKVANNSDTCPPDHAKGEDLAYVMYTSGSTGDPKGVKIQHRALVNYIWWARRVYGFTEHSVVPLYSSLAFDLTLTSIYTPLISGGAVIVYRQEGRESPIADILLDNAVTILKLTPSHLSLIKDWDNSKCSIKTLIVGGEALETKLAHRVSETFDHDVDIFNEYGPTEATVGCMIYKFDPNRDRRAFVPIGQPAANTQIFILNSELAPLAENIIGELFIAGDGLAQGYWNRKQLTAKKFIDNPFNPGSKMYRSGDQARWLPDGGIEFVGRVDDQVKFHAYRVELNAIRCTLNQHPRVKDSVITVTKDQHGHDFMMAYYVARQELDAGELRSFMGESIIEEMLPNMFVHLRRLPLTLNGKINHRALPTLEEARKTLKRTLVPPETDTERAIANIWKEVLGLEQVGLHDNFFELGGHSLLATSIVARVRELFNVELPLRSLFTVPTVAGLVEHIDAARWATQVPTIPVAAGAVNVEEGLL
jgi:tyrocidine synthetase-3